MIVALIALEQQTHKSSVEKRKHTVVTVASVFLFPHS